MQQVDQSGATGTKTSPRPATPANLIDFERAFRDEWDCARYHRLTRWPDGFVCPQWSSPAFTDTPDMS